MEYSELIDLFLSPSKSLLVSPAGYGKTYTIAECVKCISGKCLILTHTHAGISSIKKKIADKEIPKEKFQIETITSYAQKYVKSYFVGELPSQEDGNYWQIVLEKAKEIFEISHIKDVITSSYTQLFVDEYQDCTKSQHEMILALSDILPVHILGDPLQGIMDYGEALVDFNVDLQAFKNCPELDIPHRWYQKENNKELGDYLKTIRTTLNSADKVIDLNSVIKTQVDFRNTNEDIYGYSFLSDPRNTYKKQLQSLVNQPSSSLLFLVPEYYDGKRLRGLISDRVGLKSRIDFSNQLYLLEAIDDKSFYATARAIDELIINIPTARKQIKNISDIMEKFFNKTDIEKWLKDDSFINKREQKKEAKILKIMIETFIQNPTPKNIYNTLLFFKKGLGLKIKRYPLYKSIEDCLLSDDAEISIYQAMINQKNKMRRVGRKVEGKCIGTTALTKGLEFDTVVILDAHNFKDSKNLYVALTRASKKLIVFSKEKILTIKD